MKKLLVGLLVLGSVSAFSQVEVGESSDAKKASEFLMLHPKMIQSALKQLPSPGSKRCYPYMNYIETNLSSFSKNGSRTTFVFEYECRGIDRAIVQARIELVENRVDDSPRDDYMSYDVKVIDTTVK